MDKSEEIAYEQGRRAVFAQMLRDALKGLGYDSEEGAANRWALERAEAIATLREICREHGDNDWEDNLHLSDILTKHLENYLEEKDDDRQSAKGEWFKMRSAPEHTDGFPVLLKFPGGAVRPGLIYTQRNSDNSRRIAVEGVWINYTHDPPETKAEMPTHWQPIGG